MKLLKPAIKLVLVAALLWFFASKGFISLAGMGNALTRWEYMVPVLLITFITNGLIALRWQWLLKAQGIEVPLLRAFELSWIGLFFNLAIPGAISGDVLKAYYVGFEAPGKRTKALASILFDRVVGVSALVLVCAGAYLSGLVLLDSNTTLKILRGIVLLTASGVVGFFSYVFLIPDHYDPLLVFFKKLQALHARAGALLNTYTAIRSYKHHPGLVAKSLALSVCVHLLTGWTFLEAQRALGDLNSGILQTYLVVPLGLLVTSVPVLPGGLGTGHAAFLYLYRLLGSERGADIFSIVFLFGCLIGGLGGLVYVRFKPLAPPPPIG